MERKTPKLYPHASDDEIDDALYDDEDASDDEGEGENVPDKKQ